MRLDRRRDLLLLPGAKTMKGRKKKESAKNMKTGLTGLIGEMDGMLNKYRRVLKHSAMPRTRHDRQKRFDFSECSVHALFPYFH